MIASVLGCCRGCGASFRRELESASAFGDCHAPASGVDLQPNDGAIGASDERVRGAGWHGKAQRFAGLPTVEHGLRYGIRVEDGHEQPGRGRQSCGDESLPRPGSFLAVKIGDPVAVLHFGLPSRRGVLIALSACRTVADVRLAPDWIHTLDVSKLQRLRISDAERASIRAAAFGAFA